jgi:hypothetical protein
MTAAEQYTERIYAAMRATEQRRREEEWDRDGAVEFQAFIEKEDQS